jgi:hypothetical protein
VQNYELLWTDNNWPDIQLDIWAFSISGIRPDIRQVKSSIRPDTGCTVNKRPDYPAGYPVHPYIFIINKFSLFLFCNLFPLCIVSLEK